VVVKEVAEVAAVEAMANVVETANVEATARDAKEVMAKTEAAIVPVANAEDADAAKAVEAADVAVTDPELPSLKARQVQLSNAPNEEAREKDSKASPAKTLTPWIARMVPDVDAVATARVVTVEVDGAMKRSLSLKVKPQLLKMLKQPSQPPSKENANRESPVRDVRGPRDQLKRKRNPNPSLKKKR